LFIAYAVIFLLSAGIIICITSVGGGSISTTIAGAMRRSWCFVDARPYLVITSLAAFLIPMSLPALLALAYRVSTDGSQAYSTLALVSSLGIFIGALIVGRLAAIGSLRTVGVGLLLPGVFSIAIAMTQLYRVGI